MKQPKYKGKELLPLSVIDAACDGDAQANIINLSMDVTHLNFLA